MEKKLERASNFVPLAGEATFPPPIEMEAVGGCHIAPEIVTMQGCEFVMVEWPTGLPRHDDARSVRFPHGMMRFGESIEGCTSRLVHSQLGMEVDWFKVAHVYSDVDEKNHWHIEPLVLAFLSGDVNLHSEASRVVRFLGTELPAGAVWSKESFAEALDLYLAPLISSKVK